MWKVRTTLWQKPYLTCKWLTWLSIATIKANSESLSNHQIFDLIKKLNKSGTPGQFTVTETHECNEIIRKNQTHETQRTKFQNYFKQLKCNLFRVNRQTEHTDDRQIYEAKGSGTKAWRQGRATCCTLLVSFFLSCLPMNEIKSSSKMWDTRSILIRVTPLLLNGWNGLAYGQSAN